MHVSKIQHGLNWHLSVDDADKELFRYVRCGFALRWHFHGPMITVEVVSHYSGVHAGITYLVHC